jgi:hypothetical protein
MISFDLRDGRHKELKLSTSGERRVCARQPPRPTPVAGKKHIKQYKAFNWCPLYGGAASSAGFKCCMPSPAPGQSEDYFLSRISPEA